MAKKEWDDLLRRAVQGDAEAQWEVANGFAGGLADLRGRVFVRPNARSAFAWFKRSAESGDAGALCNLGYCFDVGLGCRRDQVEALRLYKKAFRQGLGGAAANIATIYRDRGDAVRAFFWYQRDAAASYGNSLVELGWRYYRGIGVRRNAEEALRCFRKALVHRFIDEAGREEAMYHLGVAYWEGQGVRRSVARAVQWLERANVDNDYPIAAELLEQIESRKDPIRGGQARGR